MIQHVPHEWTVDGDQDVVFVDPGGVERRVPAFCGADGQWRVRYAADQTGEHQLRANGRSQIVVVEAYDGDNPLYQHGRLCVAPSGRHLEHIDGTPFFWLGDTWWMGLVDRLKWPDDFQLLAADRASKGFNLVQMVAGIYPDMPWYDPRGANEAGYPWEKDYSAMNAAWFDMADRRIAHLVEQGIVPLLVGAWGYHLPWMGVDKLKEHWRTMIARWGAYPVVWCVAGETTMPYYLSEDRDGDEAMQKRGWTEIARYVRDCDPWHNPMTVHPTNETDSFDQLEDDACIDVNILQVWSHKDIVEQTVRGRRRTPATPVLTSEFAFEGICAKFRHDDQREAFWSAMLSGAAGHTYGANGIWQVNNPGEPYGPSPHGASWGDTPWQEAYQLPGATQMSIGKRFFERYEWWRFEPHPQWIEPHWAQGDYAQPYAAGIPGEVRIHHIPNYRGPADITLCELEPNVTYRASLFSPIDGHERPIDEVTADAAGRWPVPFKRAPVFQDWVLVLEYSR